MFSEPITITVNSVAKVMPRVSTKDLSSKYALSDGTFRLEISHQPSKDRVRSMARFTQRAIVTNPLDSTSNDYDELSFYSVIDRPLYGFSQTQVEQLVAAFQTWLNTAAVDKLYGQES